MKFYKHSDGSVKLWPEKIPHGWEFFITSDFKQVWRKIKKRA